MVKLFHKMVAAIVDALISNSMNSDASSWPPGAKKRTLQLETSLNHAHHRSCRQGSLSCGIRSSEFGNVHQLPIFIDFVRGGARLVNIPQEIAIWKAVTGAMLIFINYFAANLRSLDEISESTSSSLEWVSYLRSNEGSAGFYSRIYPSTSIVCDPESIGERS